MKRFNIRSFEEFINENLLSQVFQRFYMLVRKPFPTESENLLGRMIGEGRDILFDQLSIDNSNYKSLPILPGIPILNFTEDNDIVDLMLKNNIIEDSALYNRPNESRKVSDKVSFHSLFSQSQYVPKTVFSIEDTNELKFPIIAKPSNGKSAEGIKKFKTAEELKDSTEKFDIFSEMIDINEEYRCFCFRDEILELNMRVKIKGSSDFLEDSKTKTDFIYKDINPEKYEYVQEINELISECRKMINLDFYSIDFAETPDGKLYIIEMNSRTGMGVDKMTQLYSKIYEDFYKKPVDDFTVTKLENLKKEWEDAYEKEKSSDINECTVVAGNLEDKMFLFKNRDRSYTPDSIVKREILNGVEIVYYTDQTGWIEGMNEYGVGFVFSALTTNKYNGYDPSYYVSDEPKSADKFKPFAKDIKNVLTSKNVEDAIKLIEKSKKSGNFLIGDKKEIVEMEVFDGKIVKEKIDKTQLKIKTNHGELISHAGHQPDPYSIKRAGSSIRKYQAELQLSGVKSLSDIPTRMKAQVYDTNSPLNVFRTDAEEHTISQCLMNLTDLRFYFFHDNLTADSVKFEGKEKGKINVSIRINASYKCI
jgi:hypothetical protein